VQAAELALVQASCKRTSSQAHKLRNCLLPPWSPSSSASSENVSRYSACNAGALSSREHRFRPSHSRVCPLSTPATRSTSVFVCIQSCCPLSTLQHVALVCLYAYRDAACSALLQHEALAGLYAYRGGGVYARQEPYRMARTGKPSVFNHEAFPSKSGKN